MADAVERAQTHAVFADYIRRELPNHGDKLAAMESVESLLEHPGWALVERLVGTKVDGLMAGLDAGAEGVRPHAEYIANHAQRFGMRTVLDLPQTVRVIGQESIDNENAQAGGR